LAAFRTGFADYDAMIWDKQFKQGVAGGTLDALGDEAVKDLANGRCTDR
jgi:hypothetical protein